MIVDDLFSKARAVLESRHRFHYRSVARTRLDLQLDEFIQPNNQGSIVQVKGDPGSGITSVLKNLAIRHTSSALWLPCNVFASDVTLIDHVCEHLSLRDPGEHHRTVPQYLIEFTKLTRCHTLIIDDLDRFNVTAPGVKDVSVYIEMLTMKAHYTIIFSTHSESLSSSISKIDKNRKHDVLLNDRFNIATIGETAKEFWRCNNHHLDLNLPICRGVDLLSLMQNSTISSLMECLEILYVKQLLGSLERQLEGQDKFFLRNFTVLRYEVENALYS